MAIDRTCWMSGLKDNLLMSNLTIPGTHDSAAYTYGLPYIVTQRLDISAQLDAGVRYFDLRCGLRANVLEMVHGPTYLGLTLEGVLTMIYDWLSKHKTEALVLQLKKDKEDEKSTEHFEQAVVTLIAMHAQFWRLGNTTPSLGQLRGRIQLFRRFRGEGISAYGINVSRWQDNPLKPFTMDAGHGVSITVQDHYRFDERVALPVLVEQKSAEIAELVQRARSDPVAKNWYINYSSAVEFNWTYRYAPKDIAEGSWYGFTRVQGVNQTLRESFSSDRRQRMGIMAMDFPDSALIDALIETNFSTDDRAWRSAILLLALTLCFLLATHIDHPDVSYFCARLCSHFGA